jgi:hypothetical protein
MNAKHRKGCGELVMIYLAGPLAELQFSGTLDTASSTDDMEKVYMYEMHLCCGSRPDQYTSLLLPKIMEHLNDPLVWSAVKGIATALTKRRSLTGRQICDVGREIVPRSGAQFEALAKKLSECSLVMRSEIQSTVTA